MLYKKTTLSTLLAARVANKEHVQAGKQQAGTVAIAMVHAIMFLKQWDRWFLVSNILSDTNSVQLSIYFHLKHK